jgi:hypothetical protein
MCSSNPFIALYAAWMWGCAVLAALESNTAAYKGANCTHEI